MLSGHPSSSFYFRLAKHFCLCAGTWTFAACTTCCVYLLLWRAPPAAGRGRRINTIQLCAGKNIAIFAPAECSRLVPGRPASGSQLRGAWTTCIESQSSEEPRPPRRPWQPGSSTDGYTMCVYGLAILSSHPFFSLFWVLNFWKCWISIFDVHSTASNDSKKNITSKRAPRKAARTFGEAFSEAGSSYGGKTRSNSDGLFHTHTHLQFRWWNPN